ncbi:EFR1 family ferrodoxin [Desulfogranum marinum]|uniref:EFR1 family ferrodoxin n=1 Tax=Desulfogranum marinum TaxID=453220 RepID=UPI0029C86484|nr:EFR1 family ferrodoxin [Desulfogranum marinum]
MAKESEVASCAHGIVYFSPAGSTRQVAITIEERLKELGRSVTVFDLSLGVDEVRAAIIDFCSQSGPCCVWVGSPVYCDHAVPLVEALLGQLPTVSERYSVPFVTWGGVTSGLALAEMGEILEQQGYHLLGAAKVIAQHSSMWGAEQPLAQGHPQKQDLDKVNLLVEQVVNKLEQPVKESLAPEVLDYLSPALRADAAGKNLAAAKASRPPLAANPDTCTACGTCEECCPVQAITMGNVPIIGDLCVLCMQCVQQCPEQAFPYDHVATASFIEAMAAASDEEKETAIFV